MTKLNRRALIFGSATVLLPGWSGRGSAASLSTAGIRQLGELECSANGRLGAFVYDPVSGAGFGCREHERFTQASSYKMSLAAMALADADAGRIDAAEIMHWNEGDLLSHSPVTAAHVRDGQALRGLARAALVTSDNTAANLLLRRLGGPGRLTAFWRSSGDATSRIDRYEPDLNVTPPPPPREPSSTPQRRMRWR